MDRNTIKLPDQDFERHNERRKSLGMTWSEYIDGQAPEIAERQAEAQELIAGMLMIWFEYADEMPGYSVEAMKEEALYHARGGEL